MQKNFSEYQKNYMRQHTLKSIAYIIVVAVLLCFSLAFLPVHGEAELYDKIIRLHVIANSNSVEDQTLKLEVRDIVLEEIALLLRDCKSRAEAESMLKAHIPALTSEIQAFLKAKGSVYSVSISAEYEDYPTKNYEELCFPSGRYLSLKVSLGKSEGENWWCVLFPPLCLSAAESTTQTFIQAGLSADQYDIITRNEEPKYKIRFKLLEAFESIAKR